MKKLRVYDFDKTITIKDSFNDFLLYTFGYKRFIMAFFINFFLIIKYKLNIITNAEVKTKLFKFFYYNVPYKKYKSDCLNYVNNRLDDIIRPDFIKIINNNDDNIIISASFSEWIEPWAIKNKLKKNNIEVFLPNCYDDPTTEERMWKLGKDAHRDFKARMFKRSEELTLKMDAVLVLNFDKEKDGIIFKNYIGGATFLEIYDAFRFNKKIYFYNGIPEGMLYDELQGFNPIIINGNISLIK